MNPLEDNYRLYHVVAGKRVQFGGKEGVKVPVGTWHTLKVRMVGENDVDGMSALGKPFENWFQKGGCPVTRVPGIGMGDHQDSHGRSLVTPAARGT